LRFSTTTDHDHGGHNCHDLEGINKYTLENIILNELIIKWQILIKYMKWQLTFVRWWQMSECIKQLIIKYVT
jgi:hypothetical protein